ncbi:MAG: thioesterase family protein [Pseudomonadota bacterium]
MIGAISFETAFHLPITPQPDDFDELGHVNNVTYLRWTQDMATTHWRTVAPQDLQDRYIWVALRHEIDYRDQILPGEEIEGRTWLGRARGPRFHRHVDIRKVGAKRASANVLTDWCLLDIESRKPMRVTAEILEAFGVPG